jgi:ParB-like chromosome segregation protein Spo0J
MQQIEANISTIKIGNRHRKVLGDVSGLANSIKSIGLLHPVVLGRDATLIAGKRRVAAYEALGRDTIPATVINGLDELDVVLQAERDENLQRLDLAPSEAVSIGMAIEALVSDEARLRQLSGKSADGEAGGRGRKNLGPKLSQGFSAKGRTSVVAARAAGMSRATYEKAKAITQSGDTKLIERMDQTGKVSGLYKELQRRQAAAELVKQSGSMPPEFRIEHRDIRDLEIAPGTVDLILSDPPYDRESVHLYGVLAERAAVWLKPGGICLAYAGQLFLPEILRIMGEHLRWLWCFPIIHNGPSVTVRATNFRQTWKPVIAFVKPPLTLWWPVLEDLVSVGQLEKSLHPWQQAEAEAAYFIEHLSPAGGLVVDPFVGAGTVAVAAANLGRRFVGCDKDGATVAVARARVGSLVSATNTPTIGRTS